MTDWGARQPGVSICIPTYNNEATLSRALESVWEQDYLDFECVIVDDGSTDRTVDLALSTGDRRLRVVRNSRNLGLSRNHTACLYHSRGNLIKFLHADDWLEPTCVGAMASFFDDPRVGLAFSRRRVVTEDLDWRERYGVLDDPLQPLPPVVDGRTVVATYLAHGRGENWIGEPTAVMLRRSTVIAAGGFNPYSVQLVDVDMWLRIALLSHVAWTSDQLSTRVQHEEAATVRHREREAYWLDYLWLLHGIAASDRLPELKAKIERQRVTEALRASAWLLRTGRATDPELRRSLARCVRAWDRTAYRRVVAF